MLAALVSIHLARDFTACDVPRPEVLLAVGAIDRTRDRFENRRIVGRASSKGVDRFFLALFVTLALCLGTGCALPTKRTTRPYTPIEQLLISGAIARGMEDLALDLSSTDASLYLDKTGLTDDYPFMADVVEGWLGRLGFDLRPDPLDTEYTVRLVVQSIGTSQKIRFFGLPPAQSVFFPIALPELALYKRNREEGFTRFYFDVFETATGTYVRSTREFEGAVHHTKFTVFFVFTFTRSDVQSRSERRGVDLTDDYD